MSKITLKSIREGSIIMIRIDNSGEIVKGIVDLKYQDIKNGISGIDFTIIQSGAKHWAYLNQIVSVIKY